MATTKDFQAYISLYERLQERYLNIRVEGDQASDLFEMNFIDSQSTAWIPRFIRGKQNEVIFSWSEPSVEFALQELCRMERELNALSQPIEEPIGEQHFY